jgi:uncharacterized protein with HEPN domain
MLEAGRSAVAAIQGREFGDLEADRIWTLGLVKCLEIIGEAANGVSADRRAQHSEIPWASIIGMRNRLVHVYFDIDHEQVWKALVEDLPPLLAALQKIVPRGGH